MSKSYCMSVEVHNKLANNLNRKSKYLGTAFGLGRDMKTKIIDYVEQFKSESRNSCEYMAGFGSSELAKLKINCHLKKKEMFGVVRVTREVDVDDYKMWDHMQDGDAFEDLTEMGLKLITMGKGVLFVHHINDKGEQSHTNIKIVNSKKGGIKNGTIKAK